MGCFDLCKIKDKEKIMRETLTKITAVLFDMDGVLIDSNEAIERAWREAAHMYGRTISDKDMVKHIHGQPGRHTIATLFGDLSITDQQKVQAHIIYVENTAIYKPIAGVAKFITALHKAGVKVAIVTSGWLDKVNSVMNLLKVKECISVIIDRDSVIRGKPYPDPYLKAIKYLNITAKQAMVFEDSISGVKSAVAAGTYCVGVGHESLMTLGAKFTIADFSLIEVIIQPNGCAIIDFGNAHRILVG